MSKIILVTTTFAKKEEAITLAKWLLEKRLIACAQVSSPVESLYQWKGTIEHETEYKLSVKSTEFLWDRLKTEITARHPYDVPELVAIAVSLVTDEYKQWLLGEIEE